MTKSIENLFIYLAAITDILIILVFFFLRDKTKNDRRIWVLFIYCACSLLLNYIGEHLSKHYLFLFYALFTLIEYSIFTSFFWMFIKSPKMKKVIILLSSLFSTFVIAYLIFSG